MVRSVLEAVPACSASEDSDSRVESFLEGLVVVEVPGEAATLLSQHDNDRPYLLCRDLLPSASVWMTSHFRYLCHNGSGYPIPPVRCTSAFWAPHRDRGSHWRMLH